MNLPPLPKKRQTKEADITPKVLAYFREHVPHSCAIEIKVGNNKLLPHQETALRQVQEGTFTWKIPDRGGRNPFDGFLLKNAEAFVVRCKDNKCVAERVDGHVVFRFDI